MNNYFTDIPAAPFDFMTPQSSGGGMTPQVGGGRDQVVQIGSGDTSINADLFGFWIGSRRFSTAPFRVNMLGEAVMKFLSTEGALLADGGGLTTANFPFEEKSLSVDQTVTDTPWVDVVGLFHEIDLTRPGFALFLANLSGYHDDTDGRLEFQFTVNTLPFGGIFCLNRVAAASAPQTAMGFVMAQLIEGHNDVGIRARSSNANSGVVKASVIPSFCSYILLGR